MLVTLRKRALGPNLVVGWSAQGRGGESEVRKVLVEKNKLVSCLQMLHENETSVLASTKHAFVKIRHTCNDSFVLAFGCVDEASGKTQSHSSQTECETYILQQGINWLTPAQDAHASMVRLLTYARRQLLPTHSKVLRVAQSMQAEFGNVATLRGGEAFDMRVDEAFMLNNASTVSKLLDMLNSAKCGRRLSVAHASRLAWLAAVFCSAAPASKAFSLFNVTQMQMTTMSDYTTDHLYEQAPKKQHITLLMHSDNAVDDRIRRFNVAVRIFPADSEFVRELMPQMVGLNASVYSPVMVVAGVSNNQTADIFLSSDSLSTQAHASAMHTFLCGLDLKLCNQIKFV